MLALDTGRMPDLLSLSARKAHGAAAGAAGFAAVPTADPAVDKVGFQLSRYQDAVDLADRLQQGAAAAAKSADSLKVAADRERLRVLKLDAIAAAISGDARRAKAIAKEVAGIVKELRGIAGSGGADASAGSSGRSADAASTQASSDASATDTTAGDQGSAQGPDAAQDGGATDATATGAVSGKTDAGAQAGQTDPQQQEIADALELAKKILDFLRRAFARRRLGGAELAQAVRMLAEPVAAQAEAVGAVVNVKA